jgi:hypothetical protein
VLRAGALAIVVVGACGRIDFDPLSPVAPHPSGCADGTREGFVDRVAFPSVAGCGASWVGMIDLRTPPTGTACGDAFGPCTVPSDACALGWHMCGASGSIDELTAIGATACNTLAGPGQFSAAMSHCPTQNFGVCDPASNNMLPCLHMGWCAEPVCCGDDCQMGVCVDDIFPGATRVAGNPPTFGQGCADMDSTPIAGVLCCLD